ncbi:sugar phosphate isomerase/epimerase family protein [Clostridium estertheticum]|uniref:sugar phosphate isomerase/epimerase family protein n=1 Tax=Clostridium estertheticum TaxID=238834 RepID=UPI001CF1AEDC|nr:sugar phosphate isomerase/epimerase family protein [Clostridium estertheticum]MCB2352895.1 sugar phosphate isomerase/epimerase [Clostridium estertheticum]WAG40200.1 sugar phosphate isomerase/epimerase [Clostridium estertheticum]
MRIGIRGHDIGQYKLDELAAILEGKNIKSIQFVLKKIITEFKITSGSMTPGMAEHIKGILTKHNLNISLLGCYINLANPDDNELNKLLENFKEHIRFAKYLGCNIVGTETGALNREYVYTKDNNTEEAFKRSLSSIKILVKEAEKFGVVVGVEGVTKHVMNTPERLKRAIDCVNSNNLQVIFDPINFIDETNFDKQDEIIKKSFELFGDKIAIIHAKDFIYDDGKVKQVSIGSGQFNYPLLLSLIKERKPYIDIILEDTVPTDLDSSIKYIEELYKKI